VTRSYGRLVLDPARSVATGSVSTIGDERRLLTSVGISALGTWSYNVGIAVYAYQETGSTGWVAIATAGRYVPALLITSIGSTWADRLPRRRVAVSADLFCAAVMVLLTAVAVLHGPILLAIALAALSSGVARIQSSAALASAADLVPESRLARAAATISTTEAVATAAGPAIASLVLAVAEPALLFALNGLTFATSAALIWTVRSISSQASGDRLGRRRLSRAEATYRVALRTVWPLLAVRTLAALVYGVDVVLLAVIATNQLKQGTGGYGWLLAAEGAGGLVAAAWVGSRADASRTARRSVAGMAVYSLPLLAFAAAPLLPGSLAVQVVRGIGCVLVTAAVVGGLQSTVPSSVSARVFGLSHVLVMVGTSVGALVSPLLLGAWGLGTTLAVAAIVPFVATVALLPGLLAFDRTGRAAMAELDPRVHVLRKLAIFQDASRSTLYAVAETITELAFDPQRAVVTQGEDSDALYVMTEGQVEVLLSGPDGSTAVRVMDAPTYFGEIGLVHRVPRTATVVTRSPCRVWRIPAAAFLDAAGHAGLSGALTEGVRTRLGAAASPGS
jgi:predicted MFS family arabinose efflux permease